MAMRRLRLSLPAACGRARRAGKAAVLCASKHGCCTSSWEGGALGELVRSFLIHM